VRELAHPVVEEFGLMGRKNGTRAAHDHHLGTATWHRAMAQAGGGTRTRRSRGVD